MSLRCRSTKTMVVAKRTGGRDALRDALKRGAFATVTAPVVFPEVGTIYQGSQDFKKDLGFAKGKESIQKSVKVCISEKDETVKITSVGCGGIFVCGKCHTVYSFGKKCCGAKASKREGDPECSSEYHNSIQASASFSTLCHLVRFYFIERSDGLPIMANFSSDPERENHNHEIPNQVRATQREVEIVTSRIRSDPSTTPNKLAFCKCTALGILTFSTLKVNIPSAKLCSIGDVEPCAQ